MKIIVNCISELSEAAKVVLSEIKSNKIICFYGDMGVGKTTFIKEICRVLDVKDNVNSPTFSIVNEYLTSKKQIIYHFDFYRIKDKNEAFDLGYEEYLYSNNLCLIEWPEKVEELLPDNIVKILMTKDNENRIIETLD
ncbi:MAG: tRNA (adenosine(37)-N6)-threonylcarbamoyltransferase complex ATPase subunit type 1 TsaE [Flavobacteriales bacterium]|jgi:tRNA threonylcarbamoyladenosine biosynthesis protein TsaE|nr:tRNA (adenosine(37)-N6)-threonylcarbamoyltransferase complex ATPase subunit type 1 TsaE [Flavobacteriales bacterium]MBT6013519.1 tRNA (adenosine(37)-N6)-threonylcarbamoyltransferase complex ATPase subunit type 1 TsaE [Flavobacteriales bacterium]MBT7481585.1 tRNA (adenosine(37)-N6)-threonylcarbamoyltransferase complex ATPase subunit type 1 TsaE [Flavobacteriales bacterium]